MTTVRQLALRLAKHIGVASFDPGDESNNSPLHLPGLRPNDVWEITACLNTALYEVWGLVGKSEEELRLALRAPCEVELGLTAGQSGIRHFSGFAPWMAGCRVEVGGEVYRLVDAQALEEPYAGAPGGGDVTVQATVYHDIVVLDETVEALVGAMREEEGAFTVAMVGEEEVFTALVQEGVAAEAWSGEPRVFHPGQAGWRVAARFFPAPEGEVALVGEARRRMIEVRPSDIGVDEEDPCVPLRALEQMGVPSGWALEVVFPLALQRLVLHPDFESRLAKDEVVRQAEAARATVRRWSVRNLARRGESVMVPVFR